MPKIDVNEKLFFNLLGEKYSYDVLEQRLTCAKAELDEKPDPKAPENERTIKIELNDTNRPDLWSTAGLARQLRLHKNKDAEQSPKSGYVLYKDFLSSAALQRGTRPSANMHRSRFMCQHGMRTAGDKSAGRRSSKKPLIGSYF